MNTADAFEHHATANQVEFCRANIRVLNSELLRLQDFKRKSLDVKRRIAQCKDELRQWEVMLAAAVFSQP